MEDKYKVWNHRFEYLGVVYAENDKQAMKEARELTGYQHPIIENIDAVRRETYEASFR